MTYPRLELLTPRSASQPVGAVWELDVVSLDAYGYADTATPPTVTITPPVGDPVVIAMVLQAVGQLSTRESWRATYALATAGRYVATIATLTERESVEVYATAVTPNDGYPTVAEVQVYLADANHTDGEVAGALAAEREAQRHRCVTGPEYPADLREALFRRVARNLALRSMPLAMPQGDAESGPAFLPSQDPEVRRLEGPFRRRVLG